MLQGSEAPGGEPRLRLTVAEYREFMSQGFLVVKGLVPTPELEALRA